MKQSQLKTNKTRLLIAAGFIIAGILFSGRRCNDIQPVVRSGSAYQGSAYWARDLALPLINGFAPDAQIYCVLGAEVYKDGRLPENMGSWSIVSWSPSRQEEFQVTVKYNGSTRTSTTTQTTAPSSTGQPIPGGWVNSTVIFNATTPFRDPRATLSTLVVFNFTINADPFTWGLNFDRGRPSTHRVLWDGTYLEWGGQPVEEEVYTRTGPVVAVLVEPHLKEEIGVNLERLEGDLYRDGYGVYERLAGFLTPPDLRAYLADLYSRTGCRLIGAILIGDQPHAYQWISRVIQGTVKTQESISLQYYADLDGIFQASPDYTSPGGHTYSYDIHSGNVDWEIWIGVLPAYKGDRAATVNGINRYLDKNHNYRTTGYSFPHKFMSIDEHASAANMANHNQILNRARSGKYAWTPLSQHPTAVFYFDSPPAGLTVNQGYTALSSVGADLTELAAHGSPSSSGQMDISWIENNPVKTAIFSNSACSSGNLDVTDNVLSSLLYCSTSDVVIAHGTTDYSGGMGTNTNGSFCHNIATALDVGKCYGQAILDHVNVPLEHPWSNDRELHYGVQIIGGDPSLRL